jgi:peptidyl-prolyl cis-trans isomerase B (cyclophilin B)
MKAKYVLLILLAGFSCSPKESEFEVGQINTNKGEILIWLFDETPRHKESFLSLAKAGYWDTLSFNRVIKDFVAQGGCPDTPEGFADSPYLLEPEFNDTIRHVYGSFAAGRDDNPQMLSAGCQFYIVQNKNGLVRLDNKYTVYGHVFKGMEVVDAIVSVPTDSIDEPITKIMMDVNIIKMTKREIQDTGFRIPQ